MSIWRLMNFKKKFGLVRSRAEKFSAKPKLALPPSTDVESNVFLLLKTTKTKAVAPPQSGVADPAWLAQFVCAVWSVKK